GSPSGPFSAKRTGRVKRPGRKSGASGGTADASAARLDTRVGDQVPLTDVLPQPRSVEHQVARNHHADRDQLPAAGRAKRAPYVRERKDRKCSRCHDISAHGHGAAEPAEDSKVASRPPPGGETVHVDHRSVDEQRPSRHVEQPETCPTT